MSSYQILRVFLQFLGKQINILISPYNFMHYQCKLEK